MKPIKIETYQCPVCNTIYETEEEAVKCLSQPEVVPNYAKGDIVYLTERYPDDYKKPFLKRKITKVGRVTLRIQKHRIGYRLNEMAEIGDGFYVGGTSACPDDSYRLAIENDFLRLGDAYHWDESIIVSPETVNNWEENI